MACEAPAANRSPHCWFRRPLARRVAEPHAPIPLGRASGSPGRPRIPGSQSTWIALGCSVRTECTNRCREAHTEERSQREHVS
eukprot:scaffold8921_cov137-Isochrysis_galbana.AAC.6